MNDNLSLVENNTETEGNISLLSETPTVPTDTIAMARAERYNYSLGPNGPGQDELYQKIIAGQENIERQRWAAVEQGNIATKRQQQIATFISDAKKNNRPLTSKDFAYISSLGSQELDNIVANPSTYFEKKYAQTVIDDATSHMLPDGTADAPMFDGIKSHISRQAGFQRIFEDTQQKYTNESGMSHVIDIAKGFIPAYRWWTMTDVVKNAPTSSFLTGSNIQEQIDYLNTLPPDQAIAEARTAIEELYSSSPSQAMEFASYLLSYADSDKVLNDVGMLVGAAANAAPAVAPFLRGVGRAAGAASATIPGVLDASGQTARAAFMTARTRLRLNMEYRSGARVGSFDDIASETLPIVNPNEVLRDAGGTSFSREFSQRLEDTLTNQASALIQRIGLDPINVTRIEPGSTAYNTLMAETQRLFNLQYPNASDAVLSIRPFRSAENATTNVDYIAIQLGRKDGLLFETEDQARINASLYGLTPEAYKVLPRGDKFFLEVTKTADETLPTVRNAIQVDAQLTQPPDSRANRFLRHYDFIGRGRTKDELLPPDLNREMKTANFGAQQLSNLSQAIMERAFSGLPKWRRESRRDFMTFLERQRDFMHPTGERGIFSNTIGEFERDWLREFRRMPTEQEATAYFTYRQVNDIEWVATNMRIAGGKMRLGFENFHFKRGKASANDNTAPPDIEGRIVDPERMYGPKDDAGILVWDRDNNPTYYRKNQLTADDRNALDTAMNEQGYRIIQLNQYSQDQLRARYGDLVGDRWIDYVVIRNADYTSAPLSLRQIPFRPGGHVEYADNFFVSQPRINPVAFRGTTLHDYMGDTTLFSARTRAQAEGFANAVNQARLLRNDAAAFNRYVQTHLPMTPQELRDMFDSGRLDWDTPLYARNKGTTVQDEHKISQHYLNFRDPTNTAHNALNDDLNIRYATERNGPIHRVVNEGTDLAPLFNYRPSRLIDPVSTLARSNSMMARGRFFDDLKIKGAERFVREFGDMLVGDAEELQRYPLRALVDAKFTDKPASMERLAGAKNYRRAMLEFLNIRTLENAHADSIINRVAQRAINSLGEARGERVMDFVEPYLLSTIKDPTRFLRQVAFLPRMGFWNPKQLFLQGQGVVHTMALEGADRTYKGMAAGYLMRPLHLSNGDTVLQEAARRASAFGWNQQHFLESYRALQRSGFQNVGGEYGTLDDVLDPTIIRSGVSKTMDHSLMFFKGGERFNRLTAWNAAYLRWREANPIAAFDDRAVKQVLERADLLTMNMTRASNANWNQGWASIPTQFWSYHSRLMDQMIGGRLSPTEKARVMAAYSALYGVPLGVAGTTTGMFWTWHEQARKTAIDSNINVSDLGWKTFLDGIPQAAIYAVTGGELDPAVADTFGPNGNPFLKDFFNEGLSKKSAAELIGGASFKTISSLAQAGYLAMEPLLYGMWATTDETKYPTTLKDWEPLMDNISTLSQAKRAYYAVTLNKYFAKNGIDVVEDSLENKWNALFLGVFGTNPQAINDYFTKLDIKNDIKEAQQEQRTQAIKYLKMARDPNISFDDAVEYNKRASMHMTLGDFTEQQRYQILSDSAEGGMDAIQKLDEQLKRADKTNIQRWFDKINGTK